uniref:Uncharacterized protein n=1 Tax=Heterorhabditis bacteriophora TaxID=37862 RepID=A0A1I7X6X2_HETBA
MKKLIRWSAMKKQQCFERNDWLSCVASPKVRSASIADFHGEPVRRAALVLRSHADENGIDISVILTSFLQSLCLGDC